MAKPRVAPTKRAETRADFADVQTGGSSTAQTVAEVEGARNVASAQAQAVARFQAAQRERNKPKKPKRGFIGRITDALGDN